MEECEIILEEALESFSAMADAIIDSGNYELLESHIKKADEAMATFGGELCRLKKSLNERGVNYGK